MTVRDGLKGGNKALIERIMFEKEQQRARKKGSQPERLLEELNSMPKKNSDAFIDDMNLDINDRDVGHKG